MSYLITSIEASRPLEPITLDERHSGLAVVVRRHGRPVGFWMEEIEGGTMLSAHEMAKRIEREAGPKLLEECLRGDLEPPREQLYLPAISIAVCTRDRPERLQRCLRSIEEAMEQIRSRASAIEVLVVDNAPSDGSTASVVTSFPCVRYLVELRPGLDFARNRALSEASGVLIAYVDDDVVVDRDWLLGLAEAHSEHPDADAFTGLVLPLSLDTEAQILFELRGGFRRGFDTVRFGSSMPDDPLYPCGAGIFGTGANMAFRVDIIRSLGGFDEALDAGAPMPGGGDLDAFYRVVRSGSVLVYEPRFAVFHEHRSELEDLHQQFARSWGMSLMAFIAKIYRTDPAQRSKLRRLVLLWYRTQAGRLALRLRGRPSAPLRTILAEAWGGVVGLSGAYTRSARRVAAIRDAQS